MSTAITKVPAVVVTGITVLTVGGLNVVAEVIIALETCAVVSLVATRLRISIPVVAVIGVVVVPEMHTYTCNNGTIMTLQ